MTGLEAGQKHTLQGPLRTAESGLQGDGRASCVPAAPGGSQVYLQPPGVLRFEKHGSVFSNFTSFGKPHLPLANDHFQRTFQPKVFDDLTADCEPLNTKILC